MTKIPAHMSAVLLKGHGGFEQLEYRDDVPVPIPDAGEVLVRVGAAGVNNTDINTRTGWYSRDVKEGTTAEGAAGGYGDASAADGAWSRTGLSFPRIQGADVCGRIVAVGEGVDAGRIGERVLIEPCLRMPAGAFASPVRYFGSECDGGFAQYVKAPGVHAHAVESRLSDAALASFPCSYSTAENMLTRAGLKAGETVIVTGASGGVGSAAVQLARRRGARVIAVTAPEKADEVISLGADQTVPRDADLVARLDDEPVQVAVDLVGGPRWPQLLEVLAPGGRYAVAGAIAGPVVELDLRTLYLKDLKLLGCTVLEPEVFGNLVGYIERGEIRPVVAKTYPLGEIVAAQKAFLEKRFTGKIVLLPPD